MTEIVMNQSDLAAAIAERLKSEVIQAVKAAQVGYATGAVETGETANERSFGDFLKCIASGDDHRLATVYKSVKALSTSSGTDGGFLVPTEFASQIRQVADQMLFGQLEAAGLGPTMLRTSAAELRLPVLKQDAVPDSSSSALIGGVRLIWREQGEAAQESQPAFEQRTFRPYSCDAYTAASVELVADAPQALQSFLTTLFGQAYGIIKMQTMLRGTGVGQPLGIIGHPATITVARSTDTDPVIRDTQTVLSIIQRHLPSATRRVWLAHPFWRARLMQVRRGDTLAYTNTASGDMLFGIPIYYSEHLPHVSDAGSLLLADLSYYLMVEREGYTVAYSEHARFLNRQGVWIFGARLDGAPLLNGPMVLADGSGTNTVSPFVAVASGT